MAKIIGREEEQNLLKRLFDSQKAEFLAIYGRRRIGKTYLISEYFRNKNCVFFEAMGTKGASKKEQLGNFHREYKALFEGTTYTKSPPGDWSGAFERLTRSIEEIPKSQKVVLFFDELPWFASPHSGFLSALDYFWNRHASRLNHVLLIVCGSAASWMIKKVVNDKGGLHGRLSAQIRLQAFSLSEFELFLQSRHVELDRKQLLEIYMATGGVAKYLTYIPVGKSASQIIDELCFSPQGPLLREFHKLYYSLFENAERHIKVIKTLAANRKGMVQSRLLEKSGLSPGGGFTDVLDELEESGFILSLPHFEKPEQDRKYRLIDEYSLFYLKWIDEVKSSFLHETRQDYWLSKSLTQAYKIWSGYAFENICLRHVGKIKEGLGISGIDSTVSHWYHMTGQEGEKTGAEIDLVIDRADKVVNLCELKFYSKEFIVSRDYAVKLNKKKEIFKEVTKTRKALHTTLITSYGTHEGLNYHGTVNKQLSMDDLF